ncbi:MAG: ribosome maturation factor RimP [Elusimicrobiota bacterium]
MSNKDKLQEITSSAVVKLGYELVELQYKKEGKRWVVRLFIDKPGIGISVEDCALVSNAVGELYELEIWLPEHYVLEVSSPGIDRLLKTIKDFENVRGSQVRFKLFEQIEGEKAFIGKIENVVEDKLTVLRNDGKSVELKLAQISSARKVVDI